MDADVLEEAAFQLRERYPDGDEFAAAMGRLAAELGVAPLAEATEWTAYQGPRGGSGWKSSATGEVVYGDRPGGGSEGEDAADPGEKQTGYGKAKAEHAGRQRKREAARAALDRKEAAWESAGTAERVPGNTPADAAIADSAAALSAAATGDATSEQFTKQAGDHAAKVTGNYATSADSLLADLETAGAPEKKLAKAARAAEKGKAALARAGEKLNKAAEKISKLKAAKGALGPLGERPEVPDLFDVAREMTGSEYNDLDDEESRKVDDEHTKREAAAEKAGEKWDALSEKHEAAQEKIDDASGAFDEAKDALGETYDDHAAALSDAVDDALEGLDEEHAAERDRLDDEEAADEEPEEPEPDEPEEPEEPDEED